MSYSSTSPPGSHRHIREAITAGHAGIARLQGRGPPSRLADATDPSPSCSGPRGELCKMASLVALHSPGMAADHGLPATHLTMSGLAPSPAAAGPGRWTVSAQLHATAARRLTGPYPCPCDEPSTQGYDSLVVPTPERRRTPADADCGAGHHMPA